MPTFYKILFGLLLLQYNQTFAQGKVLLKGAYMKVANTAFVSTSDITIESNSSVIIDSSTIKIAGDISNAGILNIRNGTLEMNGTSPQTIPANSISDNILKNLIASNNFSLAGQDSVTGTVSFGSDNKTISTGGFLTLKSTLGATARVADITNGGANSGNTFSGNVHVERYINSLRGWRLLTAPIEPGAQTIKAAWQEGQTITNNIPGFGTHITGGSIANGFDQGVNPSNIGIKEATGTVWTGLTNTNTRLITDKAGYMVFIRGDRSIDLSQGLYSPPTSTVLRSTGSLKINDQNFTVAASGFTVVSNPYASSIDLNRVAKINSTNVQDNFYLWDPRLTGSNGVGSYVNVSWDIANAVYDITPATGGSGLNQYVQSGSAFLATAVNHALPGTLVVKERDKSATASRNLNRPENNATGKLITNLFTYNSDGTVPLIDGILNSFDEVYSNSVDSYDAVKIKNFSESLSSQREGILLVVERKQLITEADTIFLHLLQMKAKSYKFEFVANNFNTGNLIAVLEDSFTTSKTILDLTGTTFYNFDVINVPGSWNPNRFRVVFKQLFVLPVTFANVRAFAQNDKIKVEWKVENELGIKQYEVEKSANGQHFVNANITMAVGNNTNTNYSWLDENAFESNNYYRIKTLGLNGEMRYSEVMKVYMGKDKPQISLNTNIIANNIITFKMINMPQGGYGVSITNNLGQVMFRKKINHPGGSSTENIRLNNLNFTTGIYHLSILKPDFTSFTAKLLLQ